MTNDTPSVIPLYRDDVIDMLESLLKMAKNGELKNFIAAGHLTDGNIFTSIVEANVIEHHTLNSYLQSSAIERTFEQNKYY